MTARRVPRARPRPESAPIAAEAAKVPASLAPRKLVLIVAALLILHYGAAVASILRENPTIDEVNHLPAGITYWQTGSFKAYHHNPPLVKLWAALPALGADMSRIYASASWRAESPAPAFFGGMFFSLNAGAYLDIFARSHAIMPAFSVIAGLVIFAWSRRLWGDGGGLLSLALWCSCPNVLAHSRLITSDVGAAAMAVAATYAFWSYLRHRSANRAVVAGVVLGLAQLTKFSMLLLYALWPLLWLAKVGPGMTREGARRFLAEAARHGLIVVAASVLVIDLGYGFEGVGRPLGSFDFASGTLTRPGKTRRATDNQLMAAAWAHRENRFRGTWMARLPSPLPSHYLIGFDEQKLESDGVPEVWLDPRTPDPKAMTGYPVYLDGVLRRTGWRSYYVRSMLYKTPEGTLILLALAALVAAFSRRARAAIGDEAAVLLPPVAFLGAMTFLTDINLGLRYVLPIFPFLFIAAGRVVPWAKGFSGSGRRMALGAVLVPLAMTLAATAWVHPSYLAYFNLASGGPDRRPPRLIDSNLDWGQDLVGLRRWVAGHPGDSPIGLAYFGQVPPVVFQARGEPLEWRLPPAMPGTSRLMRSPPEGFPLIGPAKSLTPGVYAVSATLLAGLPWRLYDPAPLPTPIWQVDQDAFAYFRDLTPFDRIGHSILLYRVTPEQAERINAGRLRMR